MLNGIDGERANQIIQVTRDVDKYFSFNHSYIENGA